MRSRCLPFVRALGLSATLALLIVAPGTEPADASTSFHGYSQLDDGSRTDVVGVASTRYDVKLVLDTPTGCDQPYGTDVVYQTQWNILNVDTSSWLEIGTGHGCNGFMYWFGGYAASGVWHSLYTVNISGQYQQHQFILRRGDDGRYYWYVDATPMWNFLWDVQGLHARAGFESYDQNLQAGSISISNILRFNGAGSGTQSAFPASAVTLADPTPVMCVDRTSVNSIAVGQNTPSC